MGTNIRPEISKRNPYWIEKQRQYELIHFCLQYRSWVQKLEALDSMVQTSINPVPPQDTGEYSDPTENCASLREIYRKKIVMVEDTAKEVDPFGCVFYGVVVGVPYDIVKMKTEVVPYGKDKYYELYRRFFWLLDKRRDVCLA